MFARSTMLTGDPARLEAGMAHTRDEVLPAVTAMDGCVGLSMLINRDSGRVIVTTSWTSEDAMHRTDDAVTQLRQRAVEVTGGHDVSVQEWEIAVMHREHEHMPGTMCRVTWLSCDPATIDQVMDHYRHTVLPSLESVDGFVSASMMVDRASGKCCGTARFSSQEALDSTREMSASMREQSGPGMGITFDDVAEFELAIAHLRVPELV